MILHLQNILERATNKYNPAPPRLQRAVRGHRVAVVGDAVQQGRRAALLRVLQKRPHRLPVLPRARHDPQDLRLALSALGHGVAVEHPARHGQARPGRGSPALELEAREVAVVAEVVRGHERQPARGVAGGQAPRRGLLVRGQRVQGVLGLHFVTFGSARAAPLFVRATAI